MRENSYRRLKEATLLADDGDTRSYNDIYGEDGIEDNEETPQVTTADSAEKVLTPEDSAQLRSLANQILSILGPDPNEEVAEETASVGEEDPELM